VEKKEEEKERIDDTIKKQGFRGQVQSRNRQTSVDQGRPKRGGESNKKEIGEKHKESKLRIGGDEKFMIVTGTRNRGVPGKKTANHQVREKSTPRYRPRDEKHHRPPDCRNTFSTRREKLIKSLNHLGRQQGQKREQRSRSKKKGSRDRAQWESQSTEGRDHH